MVRRLSLCFTWLFLNGVAVANPASAQVFPTEFWASDKDGWTVRTTTCGDALCAFLVDFKLKPGDPPGYQPMDEHNPDRARRGDRMCNHIVMGGFHPSRDRDVTWDGGWIYDPDHGTTYSAKITLIDKDTVRLRGYIGLPLLGRTLVLHRLAAPPQLCDDPNWKPVRATE
jgi:uncharacterized protein (DUF2147 family)